MDYLERYNPAAPSLFSQFRVQRDLPEEERAFQTYQKLVLARKSSDGLFLVMGKLLKDIRDERMYERLDYSNFGEFIASEEVSFSRESAYIYIRTYEYFIEHLDLPEEKVARMRVARLSALIPVLKKIEEAHGVEAAILKLDNMDALTHSDFHKELRNDRTGEKPSLYYSEELEKWVVSYYDDFTHLVCLGDKPV